MKGLQMPSGYERECTKCGKAAIYLWYIPRGARVDVDSYVGPEEIPYMRLQDEVWETWPQSGDTPPGFTGYYPLYGCARHTDVQELWDAKSRAQY